MPLPAHSSLVIAALILAAAANTSVFAAPDLKNECVKALADRYGDRAKVLQVSPVISATTGFAVDGMTELRGEGRRRFACTFSEGRKLQGLVIGRPD